MTSQVTTIAALPSALFSFEIFCRLDTCQLAAVSLVSKSWHGAAGQLWARFSSIPQEARFGAQFILQSEWEKEGLQCIEKRLCDFIQRNPIRCKISHFEVMFSHNPKANISFWMTEKVHYDHLFNVEEGECVSPELLIQERWLVLGGKDIAEEVNCGETAALCKGAKALQSKFIDTYLFVPSRWYHGTHRYVSGWGGKEWHEGGISKRVCDLASKKIAQLDRQTIGQFESCAKCVVAATVAMATWFCIG